MKNTLLFMGRALIRWRTTGAIAPSGRNLSRAIARAAGDVPDGKVILELGPGTGVITRELVSQYPKCRVVAVEIQEAFARKIETEYPTVTVVRGCASKLADHLAKLGIPLDDVAAVVSGLPLLSLPGDLPARVLESLRGVLLPGRPYVQFTYSERAWRRFDTVGFQRRGRQRIWLNVPPAFVLSFDRAD